MKTFTRESIKVRAMEIRNKAHPEWGTFGVMEDNGSHFVILGNRGSTVLNYDEMHFWEVVS